MRISDWSSDVCSSDLADKGSRRIRQVPQWPWLRADRDVPRLRSVGLHDRLFRLAVLVVDAIVRRLCLADLSTMQDQGRRHLRADAHEPRQVQLRHHRVDEYAAIRGCRSEEHTSELQSLMRNSYAVFCLKKKKNTHKK